MFPDTHVQDKERHRLFGEKKGAMQSILRMANPINGYTVFQIELNVIDSGKQITRITSYGGQKVTASRKGVIFFHFSFQIISCLPAYKGYSGVTFGHLFFP